ncbi:putative ribonuclease H-like domain-containing protein [Tanacetum coccineum]
MYRWRRNRTLIEAARTMLADSKLPTTFWAEAVNTTCYVQKGRCKESGIDDHERPENSPKDINTAGPSINNEPDMFSLGDNATLEATHVDFFGDETKSLVYR